MRGPSGVGKSDLALRLIERGAWLVADDYTEVSIKDSIPIARAPKETRGKMEVRGIGILSFEIEENIPLVLVVELEQRENVPRMPEPKTTRIEGKAVPLIALHAFDASTPEKIRFAVLHL